MLQVFILSFVISVILGKKTIEILKEKKMKQIVREDGLKTHYVKAGTPTMGGIFVMLTVLIVGIVTLILGFCGIDKKLEFAVLLVFSLLSGLVGLLDDLLKIKKKNTDGLAPKKKLLFIGIIGLVFALVDIFVLKSSLKLAVPFGKSIMINKYIYIPFVILVLLSTTNSINLTDGVDGLATVVGTLILVFFGCVALVEQKMEVALFTLIVIGAFLGFLLYNWNKAKVFMGDSGSFFLGGTIGLVSLILQKPLYLFIVCIIPIIEVISDFIQVIYFKKTGGKRVFLMAPIHHHFEKKGWSEIKIVFVFGCITLIATIIGFLV